MTHIHWTKANEAVNIADCRVQVSVGFHPDAIYHMTQVTVTEPDCTYLTIDKLVGNAWENVYYYKYYSKEELDETNELLAELESDETELGYIDTSYLYRDIEADLAAIRNNTADFFNA